MGKRGQIRNERAGQITKGLSVKLDECKHTKYDASSQVSKLGGMRGTKRPAKLERGNFRALEKSTETSRTRAGVVSGKAI